MGGSELLVVPTPASEAHDRVHALGLPLVVPRPGLSVSGLGKQMNGPRAVRTQPALLIDYLERDHSTLSGACEAFDLGHVVKPQLPWQNRAAVVANQRDQTRRAARRFDRTSPKRR